MQGVDDGVASRLVLPVMRSTVTAFAPGTTGGASVCTWAAAASGTSTIAIATPRATVPARTGPLTAARR
jgi:hypothetical protein